VNQRLRWPSDKLVQKIHASVIHSDVAIMQAVLHFTQVKLTVKCDFVIDVRRYNTAKDLAKIRKEGLDTIWNYPYAIKMHHVPEIPRVVTCNHCKRDGAVVPKGLGKGKGRRS